MKTLFVLLLVSGSALADDGALLRCREISTPAARLSCYDALPLGAGPAQAAPGPSPVAQGASRQALEQAFGLEHLNKTALDAIQSTIPGQFDGWEANQKITLANGQVWVIVDDSVGVVGRANPKVLINRGAMGALYMEIEGVRKMPKVRRLR